jgi:hypothetical protein
MTEGEKALFWEVRSILSRRLPEIPSKNSDRFETKFEFKKVFIVPQKKQCQPLDQNLLVLDNRFSFTRKDDFLCGNKTDEPWIGVRKKKQQTRWVVDICQKKSFGYEFKALVDFPFLLKLLTSINRNQGGALTTLFWNGTIIWNSGWSKTLCGYNEGLKLLSSKEIK